MNVLAETLLDQIRMTQIATVDYSVINDGPGFYIQLEGHVGGDGDYYVFIATPTHVNLTLNHAPSVSYHRGVRMNLEPNPLVIFDCLAGLLRFHTAIVGTHTKPGGENTAA